ncbi:MULTISPECIES: thioredoxin family protein [Fusobacterium]|uniref:thioredoxin family protein n=1 Tax=Fusobacterium TaxID=848 RepID=UPI001476D1F7|nr:MULTISPECIES: thioredoxin family protein [Fusobacterium]NME35949.1 thioredoxin family protein [Fusobacterium sp. FSA-380-WT-3A]
MGLFDKLFKKDCGCSCGAEKIEKVDIEKTSCQCECKNSDKKVLVKILGSGCKNCNTLEENTLEALKELGFEFQLEHVRDFSEIAKYGIMSTPGLWVDGKIVSYGKVLSKEQIKNLIEKN